MLFCLENQNNGEVYAHLLPMELKALLIHSLLNLQLQDSGYYTCTLKSPCNPGEMKIPPSFNVVLLSCLKPSPPQLTPFSLFESQGPLRDRHTIKESELGSAYQRKHTVFLFLSGFT